MRPKKKKSADDSQPLKIVEWVAPISLLGILVKRVNTPRNSVFFAHIYAIIDFNEKSIHTKKVRHQLFNKKCFYANFQTFTVTELKACKNFRNKIWKKFNISIDFFSTWNISCISSHLSAWPRFQFKRIKIAPYKELRDFQLWSPLGLLWTWIFKSLHTLHLRDMSARIIV